MTRLVSIALAAAVVLALPAAAPAASLSIPLAPIGTAGTSAFAGSPSPVLGPVVLADGSVVVGLLLKPGLMTYDRVAPGSSVLVPLRTEVVANSTSATKLGMQAAGGGYLVARRDFASCGHGSAGQDCPGAPTQSSVTLFGVHGEAPRTLMHCEGAGCAPCFPSASPPVEGQLWTAGDESQVLVDPLCADGTRGPGVVELATGSVTRFSFPPDRFGAAQHGPYELSGDYVATPDGVLNFRTSAYQILGQGTDWRNYESGVWGFALLPGGNAIYGFNSNVGHTIIGVGQLYESTPGQDDHALPGSNYAYVDAAHGDLVVVHDDSLGLPRQPSQIVSTNGSVLGSLDVDSQFTGFDGKLAAGLEWGCRHDYLLLWDVAAGPPSTVPSGCAEPTLGPVRVGPRTMAVRVRCPATDVQDCGVTVSVAQVAPTSSIPAVRLGAGKQRWVTLLNGLSRRRCRALAKSRASVYVSAQNVYPAKVRLRTTRRCPR